MNKKLIIDGGGTSTKFYYINNEKIEENFTLGPGNFMTNFDASLKNYIDGISKYSDIKKVIIFAAGYEYLSNDFKKRVLNELAHEFPLSEFTIFPDSTLPLFAQDEFAITLTLGTGTSIAYGNQEKFSTILGYGHLIGDPLSGYSLSRNIIFSVLAVGNNQTKQELFKLFNVHNESELITFIYSNTQKTTIARHCTNFWNNNLFAKHLDFAIKQDESFFFNSHVKRIFKKATKIYLNGSVSQYQKIIDVIKKYTNATLISLNSNHKLIVEISKRF